MPKKKIFVSCGQRTLEEVALGKAICAEILKHDQLEPYFAESQSNLRGLNESILDALSSASGFITVMHPRGRIKFDETAESGSIIRASVWVEQEIAIAAFIARTTQTLSFMAAYIDPTVGREGLRDLLLLNPTQFSSNEQVIDNLHQKLLLWLSEDSHQAPTPALFEDSRGKLSLEFAKKTVDGLQVIVVTPTLLNKGPRAKEFSCTIEVPNVLLSFAAGTVYFGRADSIREGYSRFRFTEASRSDPLQRGDTVRMFNLEVALDQANLQLDDLFIYVEADLDTSNYSLRTSIATLFRQDATPPNIP